MTPAPATYMAREIDEMPDAAARLAEPAARSASRAIAGALRALDPAALITVARGSSDHAATYLGQATQQLLGLPVASVGPSIASIYGRSLRAKGLATLAISQSGASADIVTLCGALSDAGSRVIALTNTPESPLADKARTVIDVAAGPERAVAATKSFCNSVVAGLWLLADWAEDDALARALADLPGAMRAVADAERGRGAVADLLGDARQAVVLGRGPGLGLAQEIALKLIETCEIHASSYSGAEVLHGPSALLSHGYPVLALTSGAASGMEQALGRIRAQGAAVLALPARSDTGHPLVDPLLDLVPLYAEIEALARARGLNPDKPPHLQKETKTV